MFLSIAFKYDGYSRGTGKENQCSGFAKILGVPVVPMVAADKKQYQPFFNLLENLEKRASFLNAASWSSFAGKILAMNILQF